MINIEKNEPLNLNEINDFISNVDFILPENFIDFFYESNGAEISTNSTFVVIWKLTDMIQWNIDYQVSEYASNFFIFGSDGAGIAYSIERTTGFIFEFDFICMSNDDAIFINKTFSGFIQNLPD